MDRHQAKIILARYRPGDTLGDAEMGEALELARHDPQLAEWLRERTTQAGENLPPDAAKDGPEKIIPFSKPTLVMIGMTAGLLLTLFIWSLYFTKPGDPFTLYRTRMARLVHRSYPIQKTLSDPAQIREYFRTNSGPVNYTLPRNLEKLPAKGCAVFTWHTHPVGLIQFDAGGNTNLDLFLIPAGVFWTILFPQICNLRVWERPTPPPGTLADAFTSSPARMTPPCSAITRNRNFQFPFAAAGILADYPVNKPCWQHRLAFAIFKARQSYIVNLKSP